MIHAFIKKGCFQDSVSLMIISRKLSESENVDDVSVMMNLHSGKTKNKCSFCAYIKE